MNDNEVEVIEGTEVAEESSGPVKKSGGGKSMMSSFVMLAMLGGLYLAYPYLEERVRGLVGNTDVVAEGAGGVVTGEVVEGREGKAAPQIAKAPRELQSWVVLVERELPQREGVEFRLVHVRMSSDKAKLLVDLEKTSGGQKERFDLILVRDDFGRYVSELHELPMKLYPPDILPETSSPPVLALPKKKG